ncbi:MAG: translation elongation factor Ts [candidate division KSB1 bacterium]|jgi:elongation factor Ts|nr:translation elongation factor Ts [candidate division KSB1 bacterium]
MSISAEDVRKLREKTSAGIMDCKKALQENNGDVDKAVEYLRKKGIASAEKRAGRETKEGLIKSYIHPGSRLGVLLEVNCETDFVAKTDDFQEFTKNIAMQVAATNPRVVTREQLTPEEIEKELTIYKTQAENQKKPPEIAEKIAQGKMEKFYQEVCLMEQSYIKDPNITVEDLLKELIGKIGENISVKRFARFELGG